MFVSKDGARPPTGEMIVSIPVGRFPRRPITTNGNADDQIVKPDVAERYEPSGTGDACPASRRAA